MISGKNLIRMARYKLSLQQDGREWLLKMMPKHSVCAEIGVFWGSFSRLILKIVQPEMLHLIDPWKHSADSALEKACCGAVAGSQERMDEIYRHVARKLGKRKNVRVHRAASLACVGEFPDNYFDWIYVDGDHSYEGASADLEQYRGKVKPGGFVAGDDYARNPKNWTRDGVTRAVDDILARCLYENVEISPQTHQFILRKPVR